MFNNAFAQDTLTQIGYWDCEHIFPDVSPVAIAVVDNKHLLAGLFGNQYSYIASIDVSSPETPILLDTLILPQCWIRNIEIKDGRAYIAKSLCGVSVLDVSNPSNLVLLDSLKIQRANQVIIVDSNAYIADESGLFTAKLDSAGRFIDSHKANDYNVQSIAIENNFAYLATWNEEFLLLDLSNPMAPVEVSKVQTTDFPLISIAILNKNAWFGIALGYPYSIFGVNLDSKLSPQIIDSFPNSNYSKSIHEITAMKISGNRLYAAARTSGIVVFDISIPSKLKEVFRIPTRGQCWDIALKDQRIYSADGQIRIYSIVHADNNIKQVIDNNDLVENACRYSWNNNKLVIFGAKSNRAIEVFSLNGCRYSKVCNIKMSTPISIDMNSFGSGLYIVNVKNKNNKILTFTIFKK
jgi:hypothetical protein